MHLWGRTAAPLSRRESAAGSGVGAAGDIITGDVPLHGLGVWRAEAGWGLLHPGQLAAFLFTGALLRVTLKSRWAAVHVVFTAHALGWIERGPWAQGPSLLPASAQPSPPTTPGYLDKRAAAPGSGRQAAAGVVIRAARLHVTLHLLHWELGKEGKSAVALGTAWRSHPLWAPQLEPDVEDGRPPLAGILRRSPMRRKGGCACPGPSMQPPVPAPTSAPGIAWWSAPPPGAGGGVWGLLLVPVRAGSLVRRSVVFSLERHLFWTRSHTVSWGQQCMWSEQQVAWVKARVGLCGRPAYLSTRTSGRQLALPRSPTRG